MQKGITVEALLDSGATGLVMSLEFARKKGFKLKKLERPMQVRNVDGSFNREGPIENTGGQHVLQGTCGEDRDRCDRRTEVGGNFGDAMARTP